VSPWPMPAEVSWPTRRKPLAGSFAAKGLNNLG
jgi:hypothetical protein